MAATNPIPEPRDPKPRHPQSRDLARERSVLARKWSYLLLSAVFLPLGQEALNEQLAGLFDDMCQAVRADPPRTESASAVGARLVALGCTGEVPLSRTMDVLGKGLLSWSEFQPVQRFAERIMLALGALSCGYVEASRETILRQQESLNQALFKVTQDAEVRLRQSEARFEQVASSSASGILIADLDGKLVRANTAFGDILGYPVAELTGRSLFDLVAADYVAMLREDCQRLGNGETDRVRQSQRLLCRNGDVARVTLTMSLLRDAADRPSQFVTVVEDGTELLLLQSELHRQALHDALTGLPDRQLFSTEVDTALRRADPVHGITLCQLRLDAFTLYRNGLGQVVADRLLVEVKRRLKAALADERVVFARLAEDEFGILVRNSASTPSVAGIAGRINAELARPTYESATGVAVSASIGVVHQPPGEWDAAEWLRAAEAAMRRARAAGPGQWALCQPEQDARDQRSARLATAVPGALAAGELDVVYRPVRDLADDQLAGVAAQLRWHRAGLGTLDHDECVALADRTGAMLGVGEWQLRQLVQDAAWWRRDGSSWPVSAGLTAHQCADADLVSRVVGVLDEAEFPADQLLLWLPEPALATPEVADNLKVLAEIGVRIGLTGFGTAPAELLLVQELPVRYVRVARQLVDRAPESLLRDILAAVLPMVRGAGAAVVVDGIRSREQADWWRAAGADLATGDLFGPVRTADELADHLAELA